MTHILLLAICLTGCASAQPITHYVEPIECSGEARYHGHCEVQR